MLNTIFSNLGSGAFAVAIIGLLALGVFGIGLVAANLLCRAIPVDLWLIRKLNLTPYTSAGIVTSLAHSSHYIGFKPAPPLYRLEANAAALSARQEANSYLKTIHRAERIQRDQRRWNNKQPDGSRVLENGIVVLREPRACGGCGKPRRIFSPEPMPELSIELNAKKESAEEKSARCLQCTASH